MNSRPQASVLVEEALASGGQIRFQTLLQSCMPVHQMREVAKAFGLTPKGGYRIEKASAAVLAPLLAETRRAEIYDDLCARLCRAAAQETKAHSDQGGRKKGQGGSPEEALRQMLRLREEENQQLTNRLKHSDDQAARMREREGQLRRELDAGELELARRTAAIRALEHHHGQPMTGTAGSISTHRIHELEREVEFLAQAESMLRRREAELHGRCRMLESLIEELEKKLPKGKRRKDLPADAPRLSETFRMPRFAASFYRALETKGRRAAEQAVQAALLFCTEGHRYPGLEVKQLEGQDLWSLRASIKLRVYFRLSQGDVDFLDLVDREDQHTALRRWKER